MEGIEERFQRIWSEYTRLKAQQAVLKRSVVDEQKQSEELRLLLRDKEHQLRVQTQQADTLRFHNQRLTKRIESLQHDINTKKSSSTWFSSAAPTPTTGDSHDVLAAELQSKINENERLHERVQELETANADTQQLMQKQSIATQQLAQAQEKLKESTDKIHALTKHAEQCDAELVKMQGRVDRARMKLMAQQRDYESMIETLRHSEENFNLLAWIQQVDVWSQAAHVQKLTDLWQDRLKSIIKCYSASSDHSELREAASQELSSWQKTVSAWPVANDFSPKQIVNYFKCSQESLKLCTETMTAITALFPPNAAAKESGQELINLAQCLCESVGHISTYLDATCESVDNNVAKVLLERATPIWFLFICRLFIATKGLSQYLIHERQWIQENSVSHSADWIHSSDIFTKNLHPSDNYWKIALPETTKHSIPPLFHEKTASAQNTDPSESRRDGGTQTQADVLDESLQTDQPLFVEYGNDAPLPISLVNKASSAIVHPGQDVMTSTGELTKDSDEPIDRTREETRHDTENQPSMSIKVKMQWPAPSEDNSVAHRESLLKQYYEKQLDQLRTKIQELDSRAAWYAAAWAKIGQ